MPLVGFTCPICKKQVPLDHYAQNGPCSLRIHPDYVAAVVKDRKEQEKKTGVRVTMGLGCPRKYAIVAQEDTYPDPLAFNSPLGGTGWHALMDQGNDGKGIGCEIEVSGELVGVPLTGQIDRVREANGQLRVEDWKTGSDFRIRYLKPSNQNPKASGPVEYRIQVSLYAELYRQQFSRKPDVGAINWRFSSDMWVEEFELITLESCLNHQPNECGYTVAQLLHQAAAVQADKSWRELPLVGETIKFGTKSGCDYCDVVDICKTAARGAPF